MNKKWVILMFHLLCGAAIADEISPPAIQWQRSFGGAGGDQLKKIFVSDDGGYVVAGDSDSPTSQGKSAPLYGYMDIWVVRLDANGNRLWDRTYGGSDCDSMLCGSTMDGGGLILAGTSMSPADGNKTAPFYGAGDDTTVCHGDYWLVNVDAFGNMTWDKTFGGTEADYGVSMQRTSDGGYILGGNSLSDISGNKTTPLQGRGMNFWILRLDNTGSKVWEKGFGGGGAMLVATETCADGGFLALGMAISGGVIGDRTCPLLGICDYWLLKLDTNGNKLWDRAYGGNGCDQPVRMLRTCDGGFILAGHSGSPPSGNKTSPHFGGGDIWIVRLDENGEMIWDASFGGTGYEYLSVVKECPDGGLVIAGGSASAPGGNKTAPSYGMDYWVVRLDASGNKLWDQSYGGSGYDHAADIELTPDGGYILGGESNSEPSGNKTSPGYGLADFWVIKLGPELPTLRPIAQSAADIQANGFRFLLNGVARDYVIEVTTDFHSWSSLQTNRIATTGVEVEVCDRGAMDSAARFYRAVARGNQGL